MRKYFTLIALLSATTMAVQAQEATGKVTGSVEDASQKTVSAATISLLHAKDSAVAKINVADKVGRFQFEGIANGKYLVLVSAVGHAKTFSKPFELSSSNSEVNLQPLVVVPATKEMAGVTVVASRPMIEQKIDKTVLNVDASVTNVGATALEVLEKAPGVSVDKDGNISLKGKQGVMLMMDGRPTYLSATELSNYLKSLPASAIDQIEIMTNPSSKYDAAGNSGIINIKSKKNKQKGFNGSVTANYGQGVYWKNNESINLNYRTGKLNLFANGGISNWNGFQELTIHRKFRNPSSKEVSAIFDQVSNMRNKSDYYNLKVGADYYLSGKTTLGLVTSGFINNSRHSSYTTSYLKNAANTLDSVVIAASNERNKWKNGSVNVNMRHQFDSTGRELTADLDYVTYAARGDQFFTSTNYNIDMIKRGEEALSGALPVDIDIYTAKMDYSQPMGKEGKLEAGVKTGYVVTDNAANYFTVDNGSAQPDYKKTNSFEYKESISAAYININQQFNKFGVQGGLRYEHTSYTGNQYGNPQRQDSSFSNSYGSLFPTVFVSYKMNDKNQFGASYGRRIDRPAYQELNPFLDFIDVYTYEQGNPFLRPQFTNNFELTHTFKSFLTTTVNYSRTKDLRAETFEQGANLNGSNDYATIVKRGNIGKRNAAGIAVSAQVPVRKWWSAMLYTNYNYTKYAGAINNNESINIDASNLMFNVNNQFKFNKGWSAELSGWYRTSGVEGQILIKPMGQMNIGVGKQVMKNKGSVKLSVRDLLYTNFPNGEINFSNTEARFSNKRDSRVVNLAFTYRFGKPIKDTQPRRKIGGAAEETNRVNAGNGN